MDIEHAINALDKSEYPEIGSRELFAEMAASGLVAVFGHSDDCMEFRGSISDEFYKIVKLDGSGIIENRCDEGEGCPNWRDPVGVSSVEPVFDGDPNEPAWIFKTNIPHQTFEVFEDGEVFQRGIVFALQDATRDSDGSGEADETGTGSA